MKIKNCKFGEVVDRVAIEAGLSGDIWTQYAAGVEQFLL